MGHPPRRFRGGRWIALSALAGLLSTAGAAERPAPRLPATWPAILPLAEKGGIPGFDPSTLTGRDPSRLLELLTAGQPAGPPECLTLATLDRSPLPDTLDVLDYDLHVADLDEQAKTFRGHVELRIRSLAPLTAVDLHFGAMTVDGITVAAAGSAPVAATWHHDGRTIHVPLSSTIPPFTEFTVAVDYSGSPVCGYGAQGVAFTLRGVHTFSEPIGFRQWVPSHDVPWDKATATLRVDVPPEREASATGRLVSDVTLGGVRTMTWRMDQPAATYLFAFYIGDFVKIVDVPAGDVPVEYFTYPDLREKTAVDFANTPDMIRFFSRFHPYPFDRYAMTVGMFGGGMEHQTNSLIGQNYVSGDRSNEYLVAHELAHQWWGDLVTPLTWRDIWLNEGFATYFDCLYTEHAYGESAFRERMAALESTYLFGDSIFVAKGIPRDVILGVTPARQFSFVVYNKGAWVLHMLRSEASLPEPGDALLEDERLRRLVAMGERSFFDIFERYAERHAYGTASTAEFIDVAEEFLHRDLGPFFRQWLYEPGHAELVWDYELTPIAGGTRATVVVEQRQEGLPLYQAKLHVRYATPDVRGGHLHQVRQLSGRRIAWTVDLPSACTAVELDPDNRLFGTVAREPLLTPGIRVRVEPNPTAGAAVLRVDGVEDIAAAADVDLFDVRGRRVGGATVPLSGAPEATWSWDGRGADGRRLAAGVYFARVIAGRHRAVARVVLLGGGGSR